MTAPGEIRHEKGRMRSKLFAACLQQIVDGFRAEFFVNSRPDKLAIDIPGDRGFSFDVLGRLQTPYTDCEVWIEAKGYDAAGDLLNQYRTFIRRVALALIHVPRMTNDRFWFVSSAPFGCEVGAEVSTASWIRDSVRDSARLKPTAIDASETAAVEKVGYERIANSIRVLFLTAELMKTTGIKQIARPGQNLWTLTKELYGGIVPLSDYQPYVEGVAAANNLSNPDVIQVGQRLALPFLGWPSE